MNSKRNLRKLPAVLCRPEFKYDLNTVRERAFHLAMDRQARGADPDPAADWFAAEQQLRAEDEILAIHLAHTLASKRR